MAMFTQAANRRKPAASKLAETQFCLDFEMLIIYIMHLKRRCQ